MKHFHFILIVLLIALSRFAIADEIQKAQLIENYGKIPLSFIANSGQLDSRVQFTTEGSGCTMFFTKEGTTFLLSKEKEKSEKLEGEKSKLHITKEDKSEKECFALKLNFVNANPNPEIVGEEKLTWNSNYFVGNDRNKWQTGVSNYSKIRLKNLYDGIDLIYYGNKNNIKYDFMVQTGANPEQILLAYDFGDISRYPETFFKDELLSINEKRELFVRTPLGDLIERKPYCYQLIDGKEVEIPVQYKIVDRNLNTFTFSVGSYNCAYPLVIDPELIYSTFLGGSGDDTDTKIAIDSVGNVYIAGSTTSNNFPTTAGAYNQSFSGGTFDAFICKLNAAGNVLVYSTYFGGSNYDRGIDMVMDKNGNAYVTGFTTSSDFPTTIGAYDTSFNGGPGDAFVSKFNVTGNSLIYSTFIGSDGDDESYAITLNDSSNVFITGLTTSNNFPTTAGAYDTSHNGGTYDVFVCKLNTTGSSLIYSTFIGGNNVDNAGGIAIDNSSNVYITGYTSSINFPTTSGVFGTSFNGGTYDIYISKLNSMGNSLIYSTFIGGNGTEVGNSITVDNIGNAYITGYTASTNFPTSIGAYDTSYNGANDVIISKLNSTGSNLIYSTFLGGSGDDRGGKGGIAIDNYGNVFVAGYTQSSNFPNTLGAYDTSFNGGTEDIFISKFNFSLDTLLYSTFLGGNGSDTESQIVISNNINLFVSGTTTSTDFPTTSGAYDVSHNGGEDVFIVKFALAPSGPGAAISVPTQVAAEAGDTIFVPVHVSGISKNDSVLSFQFKLAYDDSVLHFIGFDTSGLKMGSFSIADTPVIKLSALDTLKVAASSTIPADSGTFMILKFKVDTSSTLGDTSVLKIVNFMLNEGTPSVSQIISGFFKNQRQILYGDVNDNGSISAADVSLILQYVIDIVSLDSLHRKIADVSGNGQVFAYDAALILRKLVGLIPVFPVGSSFLYPKLGEPSIVPKGNLALIRDKDEKGGIAYQLRLTGAEDVISGQWQIRYDPAHLTFRSARVSEWNKDFILQTRNNQGILSIAIAGAAPLKEDGVLLTLYFDGNPEERFEVSVLQAILNEMVQFSIAADTEIPRVFGLSQNYPNPFNPVTQIKYQLPSETNVSLVIYNVLGQRVRTLINKAQPAGYYTIQWDSKDDAGRSLASGVYFYRIKAGNFVRTKKMLLIK